MASKKGMGSTRNGRDSNPKYLGVKRYGGNRNRDNQAHAAIAGGPVE